MAYRVIQWATGGVGRAAIEGILDHPDLELVGCWVHSAEKAGQDVGTIVDRPATGVLATNDIDALVAMDADCVMYAPVMADKAVIIRLLESGKNVVTPLNWFFEGKRDFSDMKAACLKGGSTLHGTGIHPGGITERFPLMISAVSNAITHVRAEEFSDIRTYGAPEVVGDIMLFGKTPEEARNSMMPQFMGDGFLQSVDMIAHELGFNVDPEPISTHEWALATQPIDSPIGVIEPGLVAAQRFTWQATVNGEPVITAITNWYMGEEHFDKPWNFGPEGERFEVEVSGDPSSKVVFHGWHPESVAEGLKRNPGIVATGMHVVNAIPYVCRAEPGYKSYLDLPLVAGRAAPHLR